MSNRKKQLSDEPVLTEADFTAEERSAADAAADDRLVLRASAPLFNAEKFVELCYSADGVQLLRHYRGAFYAWTGTHWREKPDESLEAELYRFLASGVMLTPGGAVPFNPKKGQVTDMVHALSRSLLIDPRVDMPSWLGKANAGRSADELIACTNGIVNLVTREVTPHDPNFFTPNCLPLDFDPEAPKPKRWLHFLRQLWPDFVDEEETLQEIFGYLLSRETRQQKVFLLVGPKRAGKGTITYLLIQLLGEENVVSTSLKSMTGEFGLWPFIDKGLAIIPDARLGAKADQSAVAEKLLSVSGGDMQGINRKYGSFWKGYLGVRFLITTNELPAIADASGTLPSRFIVLKLTKSWHDNEDTHLREKLAPELPGILNWALDGLERLRARGHFQQPSSSKSLIREMENLASPVNAFLREWCVMEEGMVAIDTVDAFYQSFRAWAGESGVPLLNKISFGRALRALVPTLGKKGRGGNKRFVGVDLSEHGAEAWEQLKLEQQESRRRR